MSEQFKCPGCKTGLELVKVKPVYTVFKCPTCLRLWNVLNEKP